MEINYGKICFGTTMFVHYSKLASYALEKNVSYYSESSDSDSSWFRAQKYLNMSLLLVKHRICFLQKFIFSEEYLS